MHTSFRKANKLFHRAHFLVCHSKVRTFSSNMSQIEQLQQRAESAERQIAILQKQFDELCRVKYNQ